jgi:cation-transporting ATPase E
MEFRGLTDDDVNERISRGEINSVEQTVSRTYADIIKKNVLTVFNLILFALGALLFSFGEPASALAATGIITMNILIATIQEIRAKRRLDKIALLMRPKVVVVRNGEEIEIDQAKIVKDDVIHLRSGDQALVDGVMLKVRSIELDESLLTGESSTIRKNVDDIVYSGSYCVSGEGYYRVTAFGNDTFAAEMLASAKKFDNKQSPLQMETGTVTKTLMIIAIIFLAMMLIVSVLTNTDMNAVGNLKMAVIILDIVPIGLFLMIVIAYMIAAVRMSDSGILLQRSNSVESMSHVDTVCMDKTGTITTNRLIFKEMTTFVDREEAEHYLKLFSSATGSSNRTVDAITEHYGKADFELKDEVMFSSDRKYSAVKVIDNGTEISIIMGAFEPLSKKMESPDSVKETVDNYASSGLRTVILARGDGKGLYGCDNPVLPSLEPMAVIAIEDEIRHDCKETIDAFIENGMEIKIISGDDPRAVDALFKIAGLPGKRRILSGDELDGLIGRERTGRILETNIFGRMKPDHKEIIVEELRRSGRYVAMVGDGVNDVKALKVANVGIALQSGSGAARSVADMVLMSDRFASLPKALVEGNRTVSGMRDILKLYLMRNFVMALMIILIVGIFGTPPILPVPAAFYAFVSLSIISFFMVIWAEPSKVERTILPGVLRYAIPTALTVSLFGLITYVLFYLGGAYEMLYLAPGVDIADFGWPDASDPLAEVMGRNALLPFLVVAGILQALFVAPRFKTFSINGKTTRDSKPTILVLLLLGLTALAYWAMNTYEEFAIFEIAIIMPYAAYALISVILVIWFFFTRWVLRSGIFDPLTDRIEQRYLSKIKKMRKKESQ